MLCGACIPGEDTLLRSPVLAHQDCSEREGGILITDGEPVVTNLTLTQFLSLVEDGTRIIADNLGLVRLVSVQWSP